MRNRVEKNHQRVKLKGPSLSLTLEVKQHIWGGNVLMHRVVEVKKKEERS